MLKLALKCTALFWKLLPKIREEGKELTKKMSDTNDPNKMNEDEEKRRIKNERNVFVKTNQSVIVATWILTFKTNSLKW